jgi:hypothetical protein
VRRVAGRLDVVVERHVDGDRDDDDERVQHECGDHPRQGAAVVLAEVEDGRHAAQHQRAEERQHPQRVHDRSVDRLEGAHERAVVRLPEPPHDGVGVEAEDPGRQPRGGGCSDQ